MILLKTEQENQHYFSQQSAWWSVAPDFGKQPAPEVADSAVDTWVASGLAATPAPGGSSSQDPSAYSTTDLLTRQWATAVTLIRRK